MNTITQYREARTRHRQETNVQTAETPWQNKHIELHKEALSHILHKHELSAVCSRTSLRGGERLIMARLRFGRFHHKNHSVPVLWHSGPVSQGTLELPAVELVMEMQMF